MVFIVSETSLYNFLKQWLKVDLQEIYKTFACGKLYFIIV